DDALDVEHRHVVDAVFDDVHTFVREVYSIDHFASTRAPIRFVTRETIESSTAPAIAHQNESIRKPGTKKAVSSSMIALITIRKSPSVSRVIGNVRKTKIGRTT